MKTKVINDAHSHYYRSWAEKNATTANKTYILVMEVVHHYRRRNFLMMMSHLTLARCAMFLFLLQAYNAKCISRKFGLKRNGFRHFSNVLLETHCALKQNIWRCLKTGIFFQIIQLLVSVFSGCTSFSSVVCLLKFSFSEKTTKMSLWFWNLLSKRQNHKDDCTNFVTFSEKLNFTYSHFNNRLNSLS